MVRTLRGARKGEEPTILTRFLNDPSFTSGQKEEGYYGMSEPSMFSECRDFPDPAKRPRDINWYRWLIDEDARTIYGPIVPTMGRAP